MTSLTCSTIGQVICDFTSIMKVTPELAKVTSGLVKFSRELINVARGPMIFVTRISESYPSASEISQRQTCLSLLFHLFQFIFY